MQFFLWSSLFLLSVMHLVISVAFPLLNQVQCWFQSLVAVGSMWKGMTANDSIFAICSLYLWESALLWYYAELVWRGVINPSTLKCKLFFLSQLVQRLNPFPVPDVHQTSSDWWWLQCYRWLAMKFLMQPAPVSQYQQCERLNKSTNPFAVVHSRTLLHICLAFWFHNAYNIKQSYLIAVEPTHFANYNWCIRSKLEHLSFRFLDILNVKAVYKILTEMVR